jgi:uncharacterized protein (DUF2126 family)
MTAMLTGRAPNTATGSRGAHLARRLGVTGQHITPGFEDTWYYLWRERRLPVNVDPFDARLDDEMERARLRRVFEQKLDAVVGYVLPLKVSEAPSRAGPAWVTGPWSLRDERMYLVEQAPSAPRGALPAASDLSARYGQAGAVPYLAGTGPQGEAARLLQGRAGGSGTGSALTGRHTNPGDFVRAPDRFESAHWISRSALCVEVRDPRRASGPTGEAVGHKSGVLYVFMPPLEKLEDTSICSPPSKPRAPNWA